MKDLVKIIILSHKRPGKVITKRILEHPCVSVPEAQAEAYRKQNPECEIITHPDSVIGKVPKLQWLLDKFKGCFFLDDDIASVQRLYFIPGADEVSKLPVENVETLIQNTAAVARELGAFYFGFATFGRPLMFKPWDPFRLTGYISGHAYGILPDSKLSYDPRIQMNDDYYIALLNAFHHRLCFKDNRFYFVQKGTFGSEGGLAEFRTMDKERAEFILLRKMFGGAIVPKRKVIGQGQNGAGKVTHQYEKMLNLPF